MPIQFPNIPPLTRAQIFPGQVAFGETLGLVGKGQDLYTNYLKQKIAEIEAKYAPISTLAKAASELAYSQLMGPQFISKLLANPDIQANIPDELKGSLLQNLVQTGTQAGAFNPYVQQLLGRPTNQGQQYQTYPSQQFYAQPTQGLGPIPRPRSRTEIPINEKENLREMENIPETTYEEPTDFFKPGQTWAEKSGESLGIKKEREKAGELRAEDIREYGKKYEDTLKKKSNLNEIVNLVNDPYFQSIRKLPFVQQKEFSYYLNVGGSKEQQRRAGNFLTYSKDYVRDAFNSFTGNKLKSEMPMVQDMAVTTNDRLDVIIGKVQAASLINDIDNEINSKVPKLMKKYHMDKQEALEKVYNSIDINKIKKLIDNKLHLIPNDDDIKYMAKLYGKSEDEIKSELKKRGVIK